MSNTAYSTASRQHSAFVVGYAQRRNYIGLSAPAETWCWSEEPEPTKGRCRHVSAGHGERSAMIFGTTEMPPWCAGSSGTPQLVSGSRQIAGKLHS